MSSTKRDRPKICRCNPSCNRVLGLRSRKQHYRLIRNPDTIRRSLSPVAEFESELESSHHDFDNNLQGEGMYVDSVDEEPLTAGGNIGEEDPNYWPGELLVRNVGERGSDSESEDQSDKEVEGGWEYDAEDEDGFRRLTLEEMEEAMEDGEGPEMDSEMYDARNNLITQYDRMNARAFKLKRMSNMPRRTFRQLQYTFNELQLDSEWKAIRRFAMLTEVEPVLYDCCINSCMCYTGKFHHDKSCRFCGAPRDLGGKAQRQFSYIPIIPRLQGYFQSLSKIKALDYRNRYTHNPTTINDVFDGMHYQNLLKTKVRIDGHEQDYCYFNGPFDIAFSFCCDGYLLYKRRRNGPSATPLVVQIYNLPPTSRTHSHNLLELGSIPGPNACIDLESFLKPFDNECAELAYGVRTFNAETKGHFDLRAYRLYTLGDMVSINGELGIKGHNGFSPCRSCTIKGQRNCKQHKTNYYVPLSFPTKEGEARRSWDPRNLPKRTHQSFFDAIKEIRNARNQTRADELSMWHGLNGVPAMSRVSSVDLAQCYPWDWMHLFLENVVQNLVKLWMGKFKKLDVGCEDYKISEEVWEEIGDETAAAMKLNPAAFVRRVPNIATELTQFTAEAWSFWFIHLAPILLRNRFANIKYYDHMCALGDIMKICLQFEITHEEINGLEEKIIDWVETYEEYYYQYEEERLSACTTTIHGLLHVCDNIRFCGPIWTTWTFFMERICGEFQRNLTSKSAPWANIDKRVLQTAILDQLASRYNLEEELSVVGVLPKGSLSRGERVIDGYSDYIMRTPHRKIYCPDINTRRMVADYFRELTQANRNTIAKRLPDNMPLWGKFRIADGGDSVRTIMAVSKSRPGRNMSYVRFELLVFNRPKVLYGRVEKVMQCQLPDDPVFGQFSGKLRLLAYITPCKTDGKDATKESVFYDTKTAPIITDLATVRAVIGRAKTTNRPSTTKHWGIIDRSNNFAKTNFGEDESSDEDDEPEC